MNRGIPFNEYRDSLDEKFKIMSNLELSDIDKSSVLKMIEKIEADEDMNNYEKGKLFEDTIEKILLGTKIFCCIKNKHTSSNEFDILVKLNSNGKFLRSEEIIPKWIPDIFLIECKNHSKNVEVGLIGKFYSLMDVSKISLGIFISKLGVSGKDKAHWDDAVAFINKINLKYLESNEPRILLDFNLDDIKKVLNEGYNIVDLILDRKTQIHMDISGGLIEWIQPHENQSEILRKI